MPPTSDPWRSCRFCLCASAGMRPLPHHDLLPHSQIAQLFEAVTGSPLDGSPGYSEPFCGGCEQRLRGAAKIRADFVSVAQRWQEIMLDGSLLVKSELSDADDDNFDSDFDDTVFVDVHEIKPEDSDADDRLVLDNEAILLSPAKHQLELTVDNQPHQAKTAVSLEPHSKPFIPVWHRPAPGTRLTCDICGAHLSSRFNLIRHMQELHNYGPTPNMKCHTKDQHELWHGRKTATVERAPFICEICGFVFYSIFGMKGHMLKHTGAPGSGTLQTHQIVRKRVHDDTTASVAERRKMRPPAESRIECPVCKKSYTNRSTAQNHIRYMHGSDGLVQWKRYLATVCVVCNERCADAQALREHRLVHQPFQCEICRQRFDTRVTWELHTKRHTVAERPHVCEICQARHLTPYALRIHRMREHTGERPVPCDRCDMSFVDTTAFKMHLQKRHFAKPRPSFVCEVCPADAPPFCSRQTLRKHMELHTGVYRFQCEVCSMRQSTPSKLLEHMRQFHPDNLKDQHL